MGGDNATAICASDLDCASTPVCGPVGGEACVPANEVPTKPRTTSKARAKKVRPIPADSILAKTTVEPGRRT